MNGGPTPIVPGARPNLQLSGNDFPDLIRPVNVRNTIATFSHGASARHALIANRADERLFCTRFWKISAFSGHHISICQGAKPEGEPCMTLSRKTPPPFVSSIAWYVGLVTVHRFFALFLRWLLAIGHFRRGQRSLPLSQEHSVLPRGSKLL